MGSTFLFNTVSDSRLRGRQLVAFVVYWQKVVFDEGACDYLLDRLGSFRRAVSPLLAAALVACALPATTGGADGGAKADGLKHVTLIGDSVATALPIDDVALQTLRSGVDLDLEVAPCRRLVNPSCPPSPPNTMELIRQRGAALGPNIVMVVGYNEYADEWADSVDTTLDAFEHIGVEHVFWLTMIGHVPYLKMNDELKAAAEKHPKLTVIDWYVYSRNHPDWFQDDGLHLGGIGRSGDGEADPQEARGRRRGGAAGPREDADAARRAAWKVLHALGSRPYPGAARTRGRRRPAPARTPPASVRRRLGGRPRAARPVRLDRAGEGRGRLRSTLASSCFASR